MKKIQEIFNDFLVELDLTASQKQDAKTKYEGVVDCLSKHFYNKGRTSDDQYLFGSYKTKTNIRPLDGSSDVDVLFKIGQATYDKYKDNPSGLLQEVRIALKDKYTTTDEIHAWGKVVLVKFSDGHHNVEVLPALENEDSTFSIPNTEDGGSWEMFDPRKQIDNFFKSKDKELVRSLVKMIKCWIRSTSTLNYKSYHVVQDTIDFVNNVYVSGRGTVPYDEVMKDLLNYLKNSNKSHLTDIQSYIETAQKRAVKAIEYRKQGQYIEASQEWRKIFGTMFEEAKENETSKKNEVRSFSSAPRPWSL